MIPDATMYQLVSLLNYAYWNDLTADTNGLMTSVTEKRTIYKNMHSRIITTVKHPDIEDKWTTGKLS